MPIYGFHVPVLLLYGAALFIVEKIVVHLLLKTNRPQRVKIELAEYYCVFGMMIPLSILLWLMRSEYSLWEVVWFVLVAGYTYCFKILFDFWGD